MSKSNPELELAEEISACYADPLRFVLFAYPWGEPGPLEHHTGPDEWQTEYLLELGRMVAERGFDGVNAVPAIRMARSSGHGIGKSTMAAWLTDWIMSTRPNSIGTVTANTFPQLSTKTWASIRRWTRLSINAHWWLITGDRMYHREFPESWFCSAQTCREENSESFAGQHAASSTSWYLFDEASAVPDKIYEVAEGGLTDGEPMIFLFGNPTRNHGKFHRVCFGSERNRWNPGCIDSRRSAMTNKQQIQEWIADHGEDSDFVRVRVRGLPPAAADMQFIDADRVYEAQQREVSVLPDEPLVMGIDVARGGADNNVLKFRRGLDARSIPAVRIPGEQTRDSMHLVSRIAQEIDQKKPDAVFLDATGVGGPIGDRLRQLGYTVTDVQFGAQSPDPKYGNMRSFMWHGMKEWLLKGAIEKDERLEIDLTAPGYFHDRRDRLILESKERMKERGLDSPDYGDALACTFAFPVAPPKKREHPVGLFGGSGWMA